MSGSKKFFLGLLSVIMVVSLTLGLTFGVRQNTNEKNELANTNNQYAEAIEQLKTEVKTTVENVSKLEYQIELNGLTIDDLTKTIVVYEKEIVELENTITEKEVEIVEKNNTIVDKQVEIKTLTDTITEKEQEIVEIEKVVVEYEERIVYLENESEVDTAEIERLQGEIDNLNNQIADKNAEINNLNNQIADKNATIADLEEQIATLTSEKETAETQIIEKEVIITEKEEIIVEKEVEIETLVAEVNVLNTTIIELNVQINLMQEALDNEVPDRDLFNELLSGKNLYTCETPYGYFVSSFYRDGLYFVSSLDFSCKKMLDEGREQITSFVYSDEKSIISFTGFGSGGTYVANNDGSSIVKISNLNFYSRFFKLNDGRIFMSSDQSRNIAIFNPVDESFYITEVSGSNVSVVSQLDDNRVLCIKDSSAFVFSLLDYSVVYFDGDYSGYNSNEPLELPNGNYLLWGFSNNPFIKLVDINNYTITKISDLGGVYRNVEFLDNSIVRLSSGGTGNNDSICYLNYETFDISFVNSCRINISIYDSNEDVILNSWYEVDEGSTIGNCLTSIDLLKDKSFVISSNFTSIDLDSVVVDYCYYYVYITE